MNNTLTIFFADNSIGKMLSQFDTPLAVNPAMTLVMDAAKMVVNVKLNIELALDSNGAPLVMREQAKKQLFDMVAIEVLGMAVGGVALKVGSKAFKVLKSYFGKFKHWFSKKSNPLIKDNNFKKENFVAPKSGKLIKANIHGNAIVLSDKIVIYMRGKSPDVKGELRELQISKQKNRKLFDSDENNAKLLKKLKDRNHNFDRSSDMKRHLEDIGLFDTSENNKAIIEHLLGVGNKVTPDNRVWVPSILNGSNGSVKLESTWKILDDNRAYLTTVKLIPTK